MAGSIIVRSKVGPVSSYEEHKESLREDFWYTCAYCEISEVEADGIRFTIDHYWPQQRCPQLREVYENLMWACDHCNERKFTNPTPQALAKGYRFFNPDVDDPDEHFELNGYRVKPITQHIGEYTEQALDLNRTNLRRMREIRHALYNSANAMLHGLRALQSISVDALPRHMRARFDAIRSQFGTAVDGMTIRLNDRICKLLNRSANLDIDPDQPSRAKARRKYLARVNAPLPGLVGSRQVTKGRGRPISSTPRGPTGKARTTKR